MSLQHPSAPRPFAPVIMGVTLAIALPAPAWAQAAPPVTITDGQEIAVTLDLRHFGNVLRTNEEIARARGRDISDQRLTAGLDLVFARTLGRNTINLSANAGYDFYRNNRRLNRERLGVQGATGINAGPCLLDLEGSLERRQSDLETQAVFGDPNSDSGFRNAETIRSYSAEARCGRSTGLRPMVGYRRTLADNSDDLRKLSNYRSQRYRAGITWNHPVMGRYAVTFDRTRVSYPDRAGTPLAALNGFEQDAIRFAAARDIGTFLRADASVSHVSLKPNNDSAERFKGVSWRVGATAYVGPRLMLDLSTESAMTPSLRAASAYTRNRSHEVRATYAVNSRMTVGAGASFANRRHYGVVPVFGPVLEEDKYRRIFATASARVGYRLTVSVDAAHERRDGTGQFYDYSATTIGLRARFAM